MVPFGRVNAWAHEERIHRIGEEESVVVAVVVVPLPESTPQDHAILMTELTAIQQTVGIVTLVRQKVFGFNFIFALFKIWHYIFNHC
jgi:hypothetical protein